MGDSDNSYRYSYNSYRYTHNEGSRGRTRSPNPCNLCTLHAHIFSLWSIAPHNSLESVSDEQWERDSGWIRDQLMVHDYGNTKIRAYVEGVLTDSLESK